MILVKLELCDNEVDVGPDERRVAYNMIVRRPLPGKTCMPHASRPSLSLTSGTLTAHRPRASLQPTNLILTFLDRTSMTFLNHFMYQYQGLERHDLVGEDG